MLQQSDVYTQNGPAMRSGVMVDGVFWLFDEAISDAALQHAATRNTAEKLVTIATVVLALLALTGIAISVELGAAGAWFAALCGAFLYYRHTAARLRKVMMPKPKQTPELTVLPSLDMAERTANIGAVLDDDARAALERAFRLAQEGKHADVTPLHLFTATLSTEVATTLLARLGLHFDLLKDPLRRKLATCLQGGTVFGGQTEDVVARAFVLALADSRPQVSPLELLEVAVAQEPFLGELLQSKGIAPEELTNALAWMRINSALRERYQAFRAASAWKPTGSMNRAYTAIATPFLDSVTDDVTRDAVHGRTSLLVGRESELRDMLRAIESGNQSIVLVGESGVGKGAIIEGIAELMVEERVPQMLQDKRLLRLHVPHIVSAQGGSGAEERFLYALQDVARTGNVILVIENLHELVGVGGSVDLSSILSGELEKGYTIVIGTTTPNGYRAIEQSPLRTRLAKVAVQEPDRNLAIHILESKLGALEAKHRVIFTYGAVAAMVDLSSRYMHEDTLPQKAITLAQEVALEVGKRAGKGYAWVMKDDVGSLVSSKTGVAATEVTQDEGARMLQLEEKMHGRVIGQEHAVKAIAAALRRARVELRATNRPIANFLFLGPTGVGKTELAKTTAEVYFGSEANMLRFDMSEYQDQSSVNRLIGGNGQAGLLTEAVRKQPYAIVLLDELEKAHPDILNLFLQVMDDGRLTDGTGRTIDFTNVILIATSNAGTQYIQDAIARGDAIETIRTQLLEGELRNVYRPEFLNRFDDTIVFTPLTQDDVVAIAYLMLTKVTAQLAAKGITFRITDAAVHELAVKGFDPKFGARPLRRVIQEHVENGIAERLLRGDVARRDTLVMDAGGSIAVEKAAAL